MKTRDKVGLGILVIALVAIFFAYLPKTSNSVSNSATEQAVSYKPATREELFTLVNTERAKVGVAPLTMDERLNQSAQWMADDMATRDYYAHKDPQTGKDVGTDKAFELTGLTCSSVGENQNKGAGQFSTAQAQIDNWFTSESHKNALLDSKYSLTGLGIATTKEGETLVVQHFCDTTWDKKCDDVTTYDYNWNNDVICTNTDGSRFYTSYGGADTFLAQ